MNIGLLNTLRVLRKTENGAYVGDDSGEVLLPRRLLPAQCELGDSLEVFVCHDSEDRLMATTEKPAVMVGGFALLRVKQLTGVGAFLDWGLAKDLFLPFSEQTFELSVGENVVVHCYLDKSDRIAATMRLDKYVGKTPHQFREGQPVSLLICGKTDLGFKALIERSHWGILYFDETFQKLHYGKQIDGFIKKLRPDSSVAGAKIDLTLTRAGHQAASDEIGPKILELLRKKGGFLAVTDKTDPETIYRMFGASKKKFKIALGGLYKQRLITVEDEGIRLVGES